VVFSHHPIIDKLRPPSSTQECVQSGNQRSRLLQNQSMDMLWRAQDQVTCRVARWQATGQAMGMVSLVLRQQLFWSLRIVSGSRVAAGQASM